MILTVGREFGSGGHEIAQRLAEHYGIPLYDSNLLEEMSKSKNLDSEVLREYDESKRKVILSRTVRGMSSSPEHNLAQMQFDFLRKKASAGEAFVVVGRCSETILKDYPDMISVYVYGEKEAKVERITKLYGVSPAKAEKMMLETDKKRKLYHNSHCSTKWGDSRTYDISINSSKLGVNGCVSVILEYVKVCTSTNQ